jgi:tetratricopeptide (TPR) repeat protein
MAKHRQSKGRSGVKAKGRAGARTDHADHIDVRPGAGPAELERASAKPGVRGEAAGRRRSNPDAPPQPVGNPQRYIAIIPAALALLASINTLWNGFAADDLQQVVNNPSIKKLENIPLVFTTSVWSFATNDIIFAIDSYYRPMFNLLFTINYSLVGSHAWGWHLINTIIHAGVAYLMFLVMSAVTGRPWVSVMAASLFAVHPAHAESIAWVSGVTDPLMALFILPGFLCYWRFRETGRRRFLLAMLGLYLIGLLCKETAVAFPLMVAFCELAYPKGPSPLGTRLRRIVTLAALFVIPTGLYILMRVAALSGVFFGSGPRNPFKAVIGTMPLAIAKYLKLLVLPYGYSYQHYTRMVSQFFGLRLLGPALLIAAICAGITWLRSRELAFAGIWFLLFLAPALVAMRQFELEYMVQERYLYLPSMGFCLAVALLLEWISRRKAAGLAAAKAIFVVLIGVFGTVLVVQNRVWNDSVSLIRNCVAVEPWSAAAHSTLATNLFTAGLPREAELEANKAVSLDPLHAGGHLALSFIDSSTGRLDKAITDLERGVQEADAAPPGSDEVNPYKLATMLLNLGFLYERKKEPSLAEQALLRSLAIWPRAVGWYNVGQFYIDQGNYAAARDLFERVLRTVPHGFAPIHLKMGTVCEKLGDIGRARSEYQLYVDLSPDSAERREIARRLSGM